MAEPTGAPEHGGIVGEPTVFFEHKTKTGPTPGTMLRQYAAPQRNPGDWYLVVVTQYADGTMITTTTDNGTGAKISSRVEVEPSRAAQYKSKVTGKQYQSKEIGGKFYNYDPDTGQYVPAIGPDGKQLTLEDVGAVKGSDIIDFEDPNTGQRFLLNKVTGERFPISEPIPGYVPGRGVPAPERAPQRAPAYPWEEAGGWLDVQKKQRDLANQYSLALQDANDAIAAIQGKIASGEMTPVEADRMADLIRQNLDATLKGTTPWQMETQRQTLARDVLTQRAATGSNMAQSLLSGASGIYGKILGGQNPPYNFNPLEMGLSFATEAQGGPGLADFAKALLMAALQQQPGTASPIGGGY